MSHLRLVKDGQINFLTENIQDMKDTIQDIESGEMDYLEDGYYHKGDRVVCYHMGYMNIYESNVDGPDDEPAANNPEWNFMGSLIMALQL